MNKVMYFPIVTLGILINAFCNSIPLKEADEERVRMVGEISHLEYALNEFGSEQFALPDSFFSQKLQDMHVKLDSLKTELKEKENKVDHCWDNIFLYGYLEDLLGVNIF